ncbi:MAG TPA: hypothetical protein VHX49_11490 [Candidatus Acidoferrales bacterium]|nr:hypothetical protein [Candidatus Acidoferrales bacterium]
MTDDGVWVALHAAGGVVEERWRDLTYEVDGRRVYEGTQEGVVLAGAGGDGLAGGIGVEGGCAVLRQGQH